MEGFLSYAPTVSRSPDRPYHHGDLRNAVLAETVRLLGEVGSSALSLREVARRAGVAHTSVTHHFGDKAGLLTAVAVDGFRLLGAELRAVQDARGGFLDLGVAYVRFAVRHPAHFDVMFRPDLLVSADSELRDARSATWELLVGHAGELGEKDPRLTAVAGWSLVHGIAGLWLTGNLPPWLGSDPESIARLVAAELGKAQRRR